MLPIARNVLTPYSKQKNTGNVYELSTALNLVREMGMTNDEHTQLKPLVEEIAAKNVKSSKKIMDIYNRTVRTPVGTGAFHEGIRIINLRNVTQSDGNNDGRTGDLILMLENGQEKSMSICEGSKKRNGDIEKCITNPTCSRFGCNKSDTDAFKAIQKEAVKNYKSEMGEAYGTDESKWPSRKVTKAACKATSSVASMTQSRFNSLSAAEKKTLMEDLLRVEAGSKPADILCLVNKTCTKHLLFDISGLNKACVWEPRIEVKDYWLNMYLGDIPIGKTQVKFNNGVYHKGKTSSLTSSWNATACMNRVFDLKPLKMF